LTGCDFLYRKTAQRTAEDVNSRDKQAEYVAPVLLVHEAKMDARSFSEADCPIRHEYTITGMGPGFFERLLVRVQKVYSYFESSHTTGVFYDRALKAQMFLVNSTQAQAKTTAPTKSEKRPRASLLRTGEIVDLDTNDGMKSKLCVLTSTRAQQEHIMSEIMDLGGFFPGMTIGPYPNKTMMDADLEAASKEPVHIRIVALSNHVASRVKGEMVKRDLNDSKASTAASNLSWRQLRINAGADGGKGYEEAYMDCDTRIVIICMESLGKAKWRPSEIKSLRDRQDEYEAKWKHARKHPGASNRKTNGTTKDEQTKTGMIVDQKLRNMCKQEPLVHFKVDKAKCSHNRARDEDKQRHPCDECCDSEAFELLNNGRTQEAKEKYRESIHIRDHRLGTQSLIAEWSAGHGPYIDALRDKTNLQQRQGGHNSAARAVLKKTMDVLLKLMQAEKELMRHVSEEDSVLTSLTHTAEVSMARAQTLKEAAEKTVYFEKRYALLWTMLEVLQSHLCIEEQIPDVERLRDKMRALSYGITDMRRAHDAMKGNRQTADSLAESESALSEQLETLRELRTEMSRLYEDLVLEEAWMVYTEELMWHVRKDVKIIPLIMPGYFEDVKKQRGHVDFSRWWPERMEAMEHHALFTNLSESKLFSIEGPAINATEGDALPARKEFSQLMDQIYKHLDDWRGKPPPADVFEPPTEIPCYHCVSARVKAPHLFTRKTVEDKLSVWQEERLKTLVADGSLSDGVMNFSSASSFRTLPLDAKCILRCQVASCLALLWSEKCSGLLNSSFLLDMCLGARAYCSIHDTHAWPAPDAVTLSFLCFCAADVFLFACYSCTTSTDSTQSTCYRRQLYLTLSHALCVCQAKVSPRTPSIERSAWSGLATATCKRADQ